MRYLLYILCAAFFPCTGYCQTTVNLILNQDFETSSVGNNNHLSTLSDSSLATTPLPCWVNANWASQQYLYDSAQSRYPVYGSTIGLIDPEHSARAISMFTGFLKNSGTRNIQFPNSYLGTKLRVPLVAGQTYRLTGYLNSLISNDSIWDTTSHYPLLFSSIRSLGLYFTSSKLYFFNNVYQYTGDTPVSIMLTLPDFTQRPPYLWIRFSIDYTASGGERYLTFGNADSSRNNLNLYSEFDSIRVHHFNGITLDSFEFETQLYLDDLTLIPVSDTNFVVINPYIASPDSILSRHDTLSCHNAPVTLSTMAPFASYLWSTGATTPAIQASTPGTYTVTVDNGCATYTDSIRVLRDTTLQTLYDMPDTLLCRAGIVAITLPDSFQADHILWSDGSSALSASFSPGLHTLHLSNSCFDATDTFRVSYSGSDTVTLFSDMVRTLCPGADSVLTPLHTYPSYHWSDQSAAPSLLVSQPGSYALTVTDTFGCHIADSIRYSTPALPASLLPADSILRCAADYPVTIQAMPGFDSYVWSGQPGTATYRADSAGQLIYAEGHTACGTVRDTLRTLAITEAMGISYAIDSDCAARLAVVSLTATGTPSILWSTGQSAPQISSAMPALLTVQAAYRCTILRDTIILPPCASIAHTLYIPNAFSPNGDGINDQLELYGDKSNWKFMAIQVYDRWGEKVFESNDIGFSWDGRYRGNLQEGVMVYTATITHTDGYTQSATGSITIIR